MRKSVPSKEIVTAIARVEKEVLATNNPQDKEYFQYHERRFVRMATSILKTVPKGSKVLDIGSHFLHSSMILRELGYEVFAVDVSAFWEIDFIQKRISDFKIQGVLENDLETFESVASTENKYHAVLFTEILEHITFNPVTFWQKVYGAMKENGIIYLTTPNSLALPSVLRAFRNLFLLKGIGIKVPDILSYVTYGHHWKEYSQTEIKQYFKYLSNDFNVKSYLFSYHQKEGKGYRNWLWNCLIVLGHWTYFFSPNIESIVRVKKASGFKISPPKYY